MGVTKRVDGKYRVRTFKDGKTFNHGTFTSRLEADMIFKEVIMREKGEFSKVRRKFNKSFYMPKPEPVNYIAEDITQKRSRKPFKGDLWRLPPYPIHWWKKLLNKLRRRDNG